MRPPSCFRLLPRLASRDAEASKKAGGPHCSLKYQHLINRPGASLNLPQQSCALWSSHGAVPGRTVQDYPGQAVPVRHCCRTDSAHVRPVLPCPTPDSGRLREFVSNWVEDGPVQHPPPFLLSQESRGAFRHLASSRPAAEVMASRTSAVVTMTVACPGDWLVKAWISLTG